MLGVLAWLFTVAPPSSPSSPPAPTHHLQFLLPPCVLKLPPLSPSSSIPTFLCLECSVLSPLASLSSDPHFPCDCDCAFPTVTLPPCALPSHPPLSTPCHLPPTPPVCLCSLCCLLLFFTFSWL
uniref:Uncharacterized protein n=1 Tax=Pipistrellus kuhlii TaxID=59472 RepID=A0A7J7ZJG0_PIPKU|nr:hypothetical protein mPipKuh1_009473 [Pipistrellus kuhlii]